MELKQCKHFKNCGGCSYLDISYETQLKIKQETIQNLLKDFEVQILNPIIPSERIYFYRNKMEFAFGDNYSLGLRARNKYFQVINIEGCLLESEQSNKILNIVRLWAIENNLEFYSNRSHKGLLRYLVIREAKVTNQIMVILTLNTTKYQFECNTKPVVVKLVDKLRQEIPELKCFIVGFFTEKTDIAKFNDSVTVYGDDFIEERVNNLIFRISPKSFFQPNPLTIPRMLNKIKEFISDLDSKSATCLDIYCGSGAIGLSVSSYFEKVIGIEQEQSSVTDANINSQLNNITNCEFICDRAEIFLKKLLLSKFYTKLSTVIVDPPRAGITKKVLNAIIEISPEIIIYVSCNPQTMFFDLQKLIKFYKINTVQSFDMFPHTPHIETVLKLIHR